jgi:hypothetical protein
MLPASQIGSCGPTAGDKLLPLVSDELRKLAAAQRMMMRRRIGFIFQQ